MAQLAKYSTVIIFVIIFLCHIIVEIKASPAEIGRREKRQYPYVDPFALPDNYIGANTPTPDGEPTRCLNGAQPQGSCRNNRASCPTGTICTFGFVCCPTNQNQQPSIFQPGGGALGSCSNGREAVAECINNRCNYGYLCLNNLCCGQPGSGLGPQPQPFIQPPINNLNYAACPQGYIAVANCVNGFCPNGGFNQGSCINGTCCTFNPVQLQQAGMCPPGVPTLATCVNGRCPTGYTCTSGNICCATNYGTPFGQSQFCPGGLTSAGACVFGQCQQGFVCTGNICCPGTNTGIINPIIGGNVCPAGQNSLGPCIGNLCPPNYNCINNMCCGY